MYDVLTSKFGGSKMVLQAVGALLLWVFDKYDRS